MVKLIGSLTFLASTFYIIFLTVTSQGAVGQDVGTLAWYHHDSAEILLETNNAELKPQADITDLTPKPLSLDVRQRVQDRARMALLKTPLSSTALAQIFAASELDVAGEGIPLLEMAQRRDPRNKDVNAHLYQAAILSSDYDLFAQQLDLMGRVYPDQFDRLRPGLLLLARIEDAHPTLISILAANPPWAQSFVTELAGIGGDIPSFLLKALKAFEATPQTQYNTAHLRGILMTQYARDKNIPAAYDLWSKVRQLPHDSSSRLYNPSFEKLEDRSMFNWSTRQSDEGYSEFQTTGGMIVSSAGRSKTFLTQQAFILPQQGDYVLEASLDGSFTDRSGYFEFRVSCYEKDRPLTVLKVDMLSGEAASFNSQFELEGPDCGSQKIQLFHYPGSASRRVRMTIHNVSIRKADAVNLVEGG